MEDILPFLERCDTLLSGQTLPEIIEKATKLIEDPIYWCGSHVACIRRNVTTSDGIAYTLDSACRINDSQATCLNIEGAVARACNNMGILPPFLARALDQWTLDYLRYRGVSLAEDEVASIWCPYTAGWFSETYPHEEAMNLLHYIYGRVS